ncbi:MAG: hypothetical protein LBQ55_08485 [Treponema sp.]|jgi:hypothetical protein|nr:hypothetical protein [Treponema sp.]
MNGIEGIAAPGEKTAEMKRRRNLFLCIPSRIILNEKGAALFISHNKPLHRFETTDGERHFGFRLEKISFAWLKKLLLKDLLKKMETQIKDISACRVHLEDTIKLVFFSMCRHRINQSILERVYDCPVVRTWNRANPKKSIGPGMKMEEESFRDQLNSRMPGGLENLKGELYHKIIKSLPPSLVEAREEPMDIYHFVRELVSDLNPLVFFILAGSTPEDRFRLIQEINKVMIQFVGYFDIVNLASLLTIELVSAAERSALVRLLENAGDIRGILENPDRRKAVMAEKHFRGSTVVAAVPAIIPENQRLRFRISVYNDGADLDEERKLMEDFTERSYTFKSGQRLEEFFKTPLSRRGPGVYEDRGLCFYYLTILQDQCRKNKIPLDTAIKNSPSGESVVTTLWFSL